MASPVYAPTFQIFIRIPDNRTIVMDATRTTTGREIKQFVWWREGIPVEIQWLSTGARLLQDRMPLDDINVDRESTVWCHIRGPTDDNNPGG